MADIKGFIALLFVVVAVWGQTANAATSLAHTETPLAHAETSTAHAGTSLDRQIARYVDAVAATQDPRVAHTLARVDGEGGRLLALRSYLRNGSHLVERWSWTAEQIAAYQASNEYRELQSEIERLREAFMHANPGYELWVNPQVRSLDVQIENWNKNDSVAAAAANILAATRTLVVEAGLMAMRRDDARKKVQEFLLAYVPEPTPTVAAPGLSPHGQMRAIDFQIEKDGKTVAGAKTSTIASDWDAPGWTLKLQQAVRSAGGRFVGPLTIPREPWHYTYSPRE